MVPALDPARPPTPEAPETVPLEDEPVIVPVLEMAPTRPPTLLRLPVTAAVAMELVMMALSTPTSPPTLPPLPLIKAEDMELTMVPLLTPARPPPWRRVPVIEPPAPPRLLMAPPVTPNRPTLGEGVLIVILTTVLP